ncbi:LysM peptidoglycan-binding domain-containing protein [Cytobacillus sp. Hz8]|uniref:cell division suppressor protein YneA n=1 Tax=Cytobacillus sp. Hz8 TaxID=3347168 RepID=UPI0035E1A1F5
MKKIWNQYSYIILFIILSFSAAFVFSNKIHENNPSNYVKITVQEGESLWKISERYASEHRLSSNQFIKWVEEKNGISGDQIFPGEKIMIPVKNTKSDETQVASSENY